MVRNVDELGRIVLPKEMRRTLKLNVGSPIEFFVDKDNVVIKKYVHGIDMSEVSKGYAEAIYMETGNIVLITDGTDILSSGGVSIKKYKKHRLSPELEDALYAGEPKILRKSANMMRITSNEDSISCKAQIFIPIKYHQDTVGAIIMLIDEYRESELEMFKQLMVVASDFISKMMEHDD